MLLWIVRHAVAVEREEWEGGEDDRPLTPKGERRFLELVEGLSPKLKLPKKVIHSPLLRAVQTAQLLCRGLGLPEKVLQSEVHAGPGVTAQWIVEAINSQKQKCVAIVGHEPDLSRCLSAIIGGGHVAMAKGAMACVEFSERPSVGAGELQWLVHPKVVSSGPEVR